VRKHVLPLLAEVEGLGAEETLLNALNDSNPEVRKSAMKCLGIIRSEKAFPVLMEILKNIKESPSEDAEQIENQIYWAFGFMGNHVKHDDKTPEGILLEALEDRAQTGTISRFLKRKGNTLSEEAICIICDSLARIGTKISGSVLTELAKNKKKPWRIKAQRALEEIEKRCPTLPPGPSGPLPEATHHPAD
jgi:HEAT repeat protein